MPSHFHQHQEHKKHLLINLYQISYGLAGLAEEWFALARILLLHLLCSCHFSLSPSLLLRVELVFYGLGLKLCALGSLANHRDLCQIKTRDPIYITSLHLVHPSSFVTAIWTLSSQGPWCGILPSSVIYICSFIQLACRLVLKRLLTYLGVEISNQPFSTKPLSSFSSQPGCYYRLLTASIVS